MFPKLISTIVAISVLTTNTVMATPGVKEPNVNVLSDKHYSLSDRYSNSYVNNVFSDNILLTIAYMRGAAKENQPVDWSAVRGNFTYRLILNPGKTFAFHDAILPEFKNTVVETTNAHFNSMEGFESDGWLVGDGVCHLASFMNVVAREANLQVVSPTPHDFAAIAGVPKEYGVAIFYMPNEVSSSSEQNLYITNTFATPVTFVFDHNGADLHITVEKS